MRTNYVLLDYENTRPESLAPLTSEAFKIVVFVGDNQRISNEFVFAAQPLGTRVEYIQMAGRGPNALDFHLAFYLGVLLTRDPQAFFHILSKDKGFDPLVEHIKSKGLAVRRVDGFGTASLEKMAHEELPATMDGRLDVVLEKLRKSPNNKPAKLATLHGSIHAIFHKQLPTTEVDALIQEMQLQKWIKVTDGKIVYSLPATL